MRRLLAALAIVAGLTFAAAAPTSATTAASPRGFAALAPSTLGWRWAGTVNVYDGTGDPAWKVAEAAAEWGKGSGLHTQMVGTVATAQIVVYEVRDFSVPAPGNALGAAFYPPVSSGVAYGQCRVELLSWVAASYPRTAEHDAIHELGHCLSMGHNTTDKRSVMAPTVQLYEGYSRPQAADYRNLKSVYGG